MHLTGLDLLFWAAGFLENLGLLFVLWYRRRAEGFPFFTALIALVVIKTIVLYLVLRYGTAQVETAVAYGVAWFLLISGTRLALRTVRSPGKVEDAGILADMLFVWRWVWCLLWLSGTIAALAFGGRILIRG